MIIKARNLSAHSGLDLCKIVASALPETLVALRAACARAHATAAPMRGIAVCDADGEWVNLVSESDWQRERDALAGAEVVRVQFCASCCCCSPAASRAHPPDPCPRCDPPCRSV